MPDGKFEPYQQQEYDRQHGIDHVDGIDVILIEGRL